MAEHLLIYCPVCDVVAYRSRKPFDGEKLSAADFVATNETYPAPEDGKPLLCPECAAVMKALPENVFRGSSTVEQPAVNREVGGSNPPHGASSSSETLFEVRHDEEIKEMVRQGNSVIVITNKRIERIIL